MCKKQERTNKKECIILNSFFCVSIYIIIFVSKQNTTKSNPVYKSPSFPKQECFLIFRFRVTVTKVSIFMILKWRCLKLTLLCSFLETSLSTVICIWEKCFWYIKVKKKDCSLFIDFKSKKFMFPCPLFWYGSFHLHCIINN